MAAAMKAACLHAPTSIHETTLRTGGRVVEGTGLENRQGLTLFVGSNPTPSAIFVGLSAGWPT